MYKKMTDEEKAAKKEYGDYSIRRLFCVQKVELEMLSMMIENKENLYDKNDCFKQIQQIITINLVINKKLEKNEKR